jgi:hypothetical protein
MEQLICEENKLFLLCYLLRVKNINYILMNVSFFIENTHLNMYLKLIK